MLRNYDRPALRMFFARWWFLSMLAVCRVLVIDRIVGLYEFERRLVVKVGTLPLYPQMRFRQELHRLTAAVTPLLAARDTALCGGLKPFSVTPLLRATEKGGDNLAAQDTMPLAHAAS